MKSNLIHITDDEDDNDTESEEEVFSDIHQK